MLTQNYQWAKLNVVVSGSPESQMINMREYKTMKADPGNADQCILVSSTMGGDDITVAYTYDSLSKWMQPILVQEDPSGTPL